MSKKLEGELLTFSGMSYEDVVSNDLFNSLFQSKQLEQIEDRYYLDSPTKGISLILFSNLKIKTFHLYAEGIQGYKQYTNDDIFKVSFNMPQEQVHKIFGQPDKSGKAERIPILGQSFPWEIYEFENAKLHFEYSNDFQKIRLITVSCSDPK
ncbi:MAG: hypothetical protein KME09_23605 [Pleurocapsa minor HA4230-MV1]|jgi:hypothetical protein|nr:hypothetical protein [Pleurocapsa minor HA4230-MV1]